jgi:hypothetical protein
MKSKSIILQRLAEFETASSALVNAIADYFPLGSRCAIIRTRKGIEYRILGVVWSHPKAWVDQRRLAVKTDSRGTVLGADFSDIQLLESK